MQHKDRACKRLVEVRALGEEGTARCAQHLDLNIIVCSKCLHATALLRSRERGPSEATGSFALERGEAIQAEEAITTAK